MNPKRVGAVFLMVLVLYAAGMAAGAAYGADAARMGKEELKARLDDPDLILLDVRVEGHWDAYDQKIKNAIRENPQLFESWQNKYPRDKTIVLYCA